MKKGGFLLLAIILLIYGYQAYQVVDLYRDDVLKIKYSGKLSDITERVLSVPLETPDSGVIRNVKHVRRDENHLFMLSDNRLLHFNMKGKFINQIASDILAENGKYIVEYVLNADNHQVLVIDSECYISTFDYYGHLINKISIDKPWHKITAITFHDGFLWATAETLVKNRENPSSFLIEHKLYQLDIYMNEIYSQALRPVNFGKNTIISSLPVDELLVDEQGVYAYSAISNKSVLLEDTIHIVQQKKIPLLYKDAPYRMACIYPVRKGTRHYLSTYYNDLTDNGFTFCYDNLKYTAYLLSDGFRDDFYKTGYVSDLQPMDSYNDSYCFIKSGKEIAKKFPERAKNNDMPVLFILKLTV